MALHKNFWVSQINTQQGLMLAHIKQFASLREKLSSVQLVPDVPDTILKLTSDGMYSASSAYKA